MVKFTQTSWFEYSCERVMEWMRVAPLRIDAGEKAVLSFYFPDGFGKSATVHYSLCDGMHRLQWTGIISSSNEKELTVRLEEGPFRGFTAKHSFKMDGALTICDDQLEFQGEPAGLQQAMDKAQIRYELESRAKAFEIAMRFEKEKKTGAFAAINNSATAG